MRRKRAPVDWSSCAALRNDKERYVRPKRDPDRDDHLCYYLDKNHCRICGQRELTNWLDVQLFSKPCTGFDNE